LNEKSIVKNRERERYREEADEEPQRCMLDADEKARLNGGTSRSMKSFLDFGESDLLRFTFPL
jgi:hypothetical protein